MSKKLNLIGKRCNKLRVIDYLGTKNNRTVWGCMCDCGNYKIVQGKLLTNGKVKSCGCLHSTMSNLSNHKLYHILHGVKNRCYNIKHKAYPRYGGRGITICDEWLNDFKSFYDWAMSNGYQDNLTIDRIDNDKGYSPENCRWVDRKTQQRNRRSNRNYTISGETHCLKEWCEILNLNYNTVHRRIKYYNWTIEKALELKGKEVLNG